MSRDKEIIGQVRQVREFVRVGEILLATKLASALMAEADLPAFVSSYLLFILKVYSKEQFIHPGEKITAATGKECLEDQQRISKAPNGSWLVLDPELPTYSGLVNGFKANGILVTSLQMTNDTRLAIEGVSDGPISDFAIDAHQHNRNILLTQLRIIQLSNDQANISVVLDQLDLAESLLLRFRFKNPAAAANVAFQVVIKCLPIYGQTASMCNYARLSKLLNVQTLNAILKQSEDEALLTFQLTASNQELNRSPLYLIRFTNGVFSSVALDIAQSRDLLENVAIHGLKAYLNSLPTDSIVIFADADLVLREDVAMHLLAEAHNNMSGRGVNTIVCFDHLIRMPGVNELYISNVSSSLPYNQHCSKTSQAQCKLWMARLACLALLSQNTPILNAGSELTVSAFLSKESVEAFRVSSRLMGFTVDPAPPREEQRKQQTELPWSGSGVYGTVVNNDEYLIRESKNHRVGAVMLTVNGSKNSMSNLQPEINLDLYACEAVSDIRDFCQLLKGKTDYSPPTESNQLFLCTEDLRQKLLRSSPNYVYLTSPSYGQPDEILLAKLVDMLAKTEYSCSVSPVQHWRKNIGSPFAKYISGYYCKIDGFQNLELIPHLLPYSLTHLNSRVQVASLCATLFAVPFLVATLKELPPYLKILDLQVLLALAAFESGFSQLVCGDLRIEYTSISPTPPSCFVSSEYKEDVMSTGLLGIRPFAAPIFRPNYG